MKVHFQKAAYLSMYGSICVSIYRSNYVYVYIVTHIYVYLYIVYGFIYFLYIVLVI